MKTQSKTFILISRVCYTIRCHTLQKEDFKTKPTWVFILQNNHISGRMVNKTNNLCQLFSFEKFVSKMYTGFLLPLVVFGSLFQKAVLQCCIPSQLQTNIDVYLPVGNRTFQTVVSIFFYLSTIYSCSSVFIYICFELFAGH